MTKENALRQKFEYLMALFNKTNIGTHELSTKILYNNYSLLLTYKDGSTIQLHTRTFHHITEETTDEFYSECLVAMAILGLDTYLKF